MKTYTVKIILNSDEIKSDIPGGSVNVTVNVNPESEPYIETIAENAFVEDLTGGDFRYRGKDTFEVTFKFDDVYAVSCFVVDDDPDAFIVDTAICKILDNITTEIL